MIWELVKRDPAWKMMPYFAAITAVVWGIGAASFSEAFAGTFGMMAMGTVVAYRGLIQRYVPLHATLPIEGKQLFLSRVLSLLAFIWIPILAAFAAMAAGGGKWTRSSPFLLLAMGALITLGVMLIQCVRVERIDPPGWLSILVMVVAVVAAPMVGVLLPEWGVGAMASVIGGCFLVTGALFLYGWAAVPKCFQLAPIKLQRAERISKGAEREQTSPWRTVIRAVYFANWRTLAWPPLVIVMMLLSLVIGQQFSLFAGMYVTLAPSEYRANLRWMLHLPISARKLAWLLWFPPAAIVILWVTLNAGMSSLGFSSLALGHEPAVHTQARFGESGTPKLYVPAGYWRWARGGIAPVIEAPWGETCQSETAGIGLYEIYNPYSVGRENSQRFLDWQFQRATGIVYGREVSLSQEAALPGMKTMMQRPRAQIIIAALALLYLLITMCAFHLSTWKRLGRTGRGLRMLISVTPMVASYFVLIGPIPQGGGSYGLESMVLQLSRVLPDSLWFLGLTALAAIAGLYWLADRLWIENEFGQIEILAKQQAAGR